RNAINTTHKHLKELYSFKSLPQGVLCNYIDIQISIPISTDETPVDVLKIADDILNSRIPIKYSNVSATDEEVSTLRTLLPPHYSIYFKPPILEITYDTESHA